MKALLCLACVDVVAPHRDWRTNRDWRWCQCGQSGVRWRNGDTGIVEVTSTTDREYIRVVGFNNLMLVAGAADRPRITDQQWRDLHDETCRNVPANYLFHPTHRNCWTVIMRPGETSDTIYVDPPAPPEDPEK